MKILEVRDGFIKFEADHNIYLSSFIQVNGCEKNYIAQVNQIKTIGNVSIASAKFLFVNINEELYEYDKTLPSIDANIEPFTEDILNNSINAKNPVIIGKTLDNCLNINIDSTAFDKKMLISVDSAELNNVLIRNFSKQFEHLKKNTIVIDTLGIINAKKFVAGKDFKLALNTKNLNFMYESCLNDATAESKSTIMEIFKELAEYSETVPFVPFETLKAIVDDMVDKQHIFKLFILKNKLAKFEKLGYFATTKEEAENLNKILQSGPAIIDLSQLDILFQNRYLDFIYESLQSFDNIQVFLETSNTVSKKMLKKILVESDTPTTVVTHSKFKYLNDIKNLFDNFMIEPSITNNELFSVYASFLTSMQRNTYLTAGEAINYIPIVSESQIIDDVTPYNENTDSQNNINIDETEELPEEEETDNFGEDIADISIEEEYDEEDDDDIDNENEKEDEHLNITNDEIITAIDKKADSTIDSLAENLENPDNIDLFSEEDETEGIDKAEEETDIITEESNLELTEESEENPEFTDTEESEDYGIVNILEEQDEEISETTEEISKDESEYIEASYNEIVEPETNSFAEELQEETIEENIITEFDGENQTIGEIEDDSLIQSDNDILEELSETDNEVIQETTDDSEVEIELQDNTINEPELEQTEEFEINDVPEEISIESDDDINLLLEENAEEQDYTEEIPPTNLDIDLSEPAVIPLSGEELSHDFDEIVELDSSEAGEEDIVVDLNEDDDNKLDEEVEQQIMEDVDKVYTTMKNEEPLEEISDSDLDLIDQLNNDEDELEEYTGEELEEISDSQDGIINEVHEDIAPKEDQNDSGEILEKRDSNTPIVPVYDAEIPQEDMVMSDPIQQGDAVTHVKYGNGVVEKMIKYGSKTLFAINFENIGRRLLDPTLTEIKRI